MNDTMTSPFSTAIPDSAMKPTAAEIDKRNVAQRQCRDAARQRQRHAGEDDERRRGTSRAR